MLCQECHKNLASVRYAEVVDGAVTDLHLCKDCLASRRQDSHTGFNLAEPNTLFTETRPSPISPGIPTTATCETCGTTLQAIIDTTDVGCKDCYTTFPAQLESLMEGLQTGLAHRGKPAEAATDALTALRGDLQTRRSLLKKAVQLENYEQAATLRDELQRLELELNAERSRAN